MTPPIPSGWTDHLADEVKKPYFLELQAFLEKERAAYTVFPPEPEVFTALELTPFEKVKVVILGQDPYHDLNQAHGLAFSVRPGIPPPPSLMNIFRELKADVGVRIPKHGYLVHWAEQGILLLNTVLTVRAHEANSHRGKGWETFTDAMIRSVGARADPAVFVLWGNPAQKKESLIDTARHTILAAPHPSPLSAKRGFFGSRPFSKINEALQGNQKQAIDWQLPELPL